MHYIVDIDHMARQLLMMLNRGRRASSQIDKIAKENPTVDDLKESALRLFWNTINRDSQFPWEQWDDDAAIKTWFEGYTLDAIGFGNNNEEIADEPSQELYREVIDPFCVWVTSYYRQMHVRRNRHWEEQRVVEVRNNALVLENMGDWRIRDWERIQREKSEHNESRKTYY